jgi:16S rRNA (cytosine1402-N4)-methyltransferase
VDWLAPTEPGLLVDATVGLGGHAHSLLDACPGLSLVGLDRDPAAIGRARKRLQPFSDRVRLVNRPFADIGLVLDELHCPAPVAVLADLGCSSLQLESPDRGFSFQHDGPLDMRMGTDGPTAADLVNSAPEEELVRVLRDYGEERRARRVATALVKARQRQPIRTTAEFSAVVTGAVGRTADRHIHPATRSFQALRIAVNDELGQLERFVEPAVRSLAAGGRIAVISFHSLEDRIVKHSLKRLEGQCVCPPDLPVCGCEPERVVTILTRKPVRPDEAEVNFNPRARSARLRVAERVGAGG